MAPKLGIHSRILQGGAPKRHFPSPIVLALLSPDLTPEQLTIFFWALQERADIYHFHDPELMGVGLALRLCGKKVVYDVHEDVPLQIMNKTWIPGCIEDRKSVV